VCSCHLVDPLARQHHTRPFPASHIRGTKLIEFIFVSQGILPSVIRSGCCSFYSVFHSNHRAYFLDLNSELLISDIAHTMALPVFRGLRLQDPRIVNSYRTILHDQLQVHKVREKLDSLWQAVETNSWTPDHTIQYQKLDRTITESMLHMEQQLRTNHKSKYQWSPPLKKAVQAIWYLTLRLKQRRGQKIGDDILQHLAKEGYPDGPPEMVQEADILFQLQLARKHLKKLQPRHFDLRRVFLEDLAEAIVLDQAPDLQQDSITAV
jgi:hypothetical protein